ncbi:MAG: FkbM family methyltransferase [Bacteroidia bacterium]|nr:FkbM family methyltransferase [Bacteroidia bacterium]
MKIPELICFDVGARNGLKELSTLTKHIKLYAFEPGDKSNVSQNNDTYLECNVIDKGLFSEKGLFDFNIAANPSMSSMLLPDEKVLTEYFGDITEFKHWRKQLNIVSAKKIETTTIDAIVKEHNIKTIDYLKIDTQGTELAILKGAEESLKTKKINVIKTEFSFIPLYKNQPTFAEIDLYLKSLGYKLITCEFNYDINSPFTKGEKPKWGIGGDVFYCIDTQTLNDEHKAYNTAVIVGALGFTSNAKNLFDKITISEKEQAEFFKSIKKQDKRKMLKYFAPPVLIKLYKRLFRY